MLTPKSLTQIYQNHRKWLLAFARRHFGATHAEEDVHTAFLNVLSRAPELIEHPQALMARAVLNAGRDRIRKGLSGGARVPWQSEAEASNSWNNHFPDQESALLLKQVILGLPPIYRDTFVLNRFMGLSYGQIAERYGITTKAVEYRMSRALALCQEALRD